MIDDWIDRTVTGMNALPSSALRFDNSFARLPDAFHTKLPARGVQDPYWVAWSTSAAALIGSPLTFDPMKFDPLHGDLAGDQSREWLQMLAGNRPIPGSEPLAAVYSGHQFGVWAGQLGDGRALLLGEVHGADGSSWEVQLKGAGRTPYSRMGDGRAVLRSSIREFLASEAMHGLGIPTTRALAVVGADEPIIRETIETAAVVTRLAPSFVRFGSFEHFDSTDQHAELRQLADYVIERFYPHLLTEAPVAEQRYAALLREVTRRTAALIAQWQAVGFCHGVMNTDNMSILGLTLDYGPFGFLDGFDPNHICNHTDQAGRYAYAMQPRVGEWNCFRLGQALLPLIDSVEVAQEALAVYRPEFFQRYQALMRAKLGLPTLREPDAELIERLLAIMAAGRVDFTALFRGLSSVKAGDASGDTVCRDLFIDRAAFDGWAADYRKRLQLRDGDGDGDATGNDSGIKAAFDTRDDAARAAAMNRVNAKFILRNHLAEVAIRRARGDDEAQRLTAGRAGLGRLETTSQDFSEVARLLNVLQTPFDEHPEAEDLAALPPEWSRELEVSCSS